MSQDERNITQDFLRELMREQYRRVLEDKVDERIKSTEEEVDENEEDWECVDVDPPAENLSERDITKDFLKKILND